MLLHNRATTTHPNNVCIDIDEVLIKNQEVEPWSHREGLNLRPTRYECVALPTELRWRATFIPNAGRQSSVTPVTSALAIGLLCQLGYGGILESGTGFGVNSLNTAC